MSYTPWVLTIALIGVGCATTGPRALSTEDRIAAVEPLVEAAADNEGIPSDLLMGLIWVESRFRPNAVSPVGARGLTQLMPGTSKDLAIKLGLSRGDPHDPRFAIKAGASYLGSLIRRFDDVDVALAAYNMGPNRVAKAVNRRGRAPRAGRRYARSVQEARKRFRGKKYSRIAFLWWRLR